MASLLLKFIVVIYVLVQVIQLFTNGNQRQGFMEPLGDSYKTFYPIGWLAGPFLSANEGTGIQNIILLDHFCWAWLSLTTTQG